MVTSTFYIDGVAVDTNTSPGAGIGPTFSGATFFAGLNLGDVIEQYGFWVDGTAISSGEVANLWADVGGAAALDTDILSFSPSMFWKMNEGTIPGALGDSSGNGNTGFAINGTPSIASLITGSSDTAMEFTHTQQYCVSDSSAYAESNGTFTIGIVFQSNDNTSNGVLYGIYPLGFGATQQMYIGIGGDEIFGVWYDGTNVQNTTSNVITEGTVHMAVWVFDTAGPPPPTVTGISPNNGPTDGGTDVTITGTHFLTAADVLFGGVSATGGSITDDNHIIATSPPHAEGPVDIVVINDGGSSPTSSADLFDYTPPPPPPPPPPTPEPYAQTSDVRPSYPKALKPQPIKADKHSVTSSGVHGLVPQVAFRAAVFNGTKTNYGERVSLNMPQDTPEAKETLAWTVSICGGLTEASAQSETNDVYNIIMVPYPIIFGPPISSDQFLTNPKAIFATLTLMKFSITSPVYIASIRQSGLNLTVTAQPKLINGTGGLIDAFSGAAPLAAHPGGIGLIATEVVSGGYNTGTISVPAGDYVTGGTVIHVEAHDITKIIPDLGTATYGPILIHAIREGAVGPSVGDQTGLLGTGTQPGVCIGFHNSEFGICQFVSGATFGNEGLVLYRVNNDLTIDFNLDQLVTASGDFGTFSDTNTVIPEASIAIPMDPNRIVLAVGDTNVAGFQVIRRTGTALSVGPVYEGTVAVYRPVRLDATHFACEHNLFQINSDDSIQLVTTGFGANVAPFNNFFPFSWGGPIDTTGAQIHQIDNQHVAQPTTGLTNFSEGIGIEVYDYSLGAGSPWDVNITSGDFDTAAPNPPTVGGTPPFSIRTSDTKYYGSFIGGKCASTGLGNEMLILEQTTFIWDDSHPTTKSTTIHRNQGMQALDMTHVRTEKEATPSSGSIAGLFIASTAITAGQDYNVEGFAFNPGATVTDVVVGGVTVALDSPATVADNTGWASSFVVPGALGMKRVTATDSMGRTGYTDVEVVA